MSKKRYSLLIIVFVMLSSVLFADDWIVPASSLPKKAQDFIASAYPGVAIWKVELDDGKFEVDLSNGVSIDFFMNGDWKSIDGEYMGVPKSVLPVNIANVVDNTYPSSIIIEVEKEWGNYKVKLNNMMELYISADGQLMGQKFDD